MDRPSPGPPPPPSRHRPAAFVTVVAVLLLAGVAAFFLVGRRQSGKAGRADGAADMPSIPVVGKSPDEVLDEYLRHRLVERNEAEASPLLCQRPDLADVDSYVADIKNRESQFHVAILSTWGPFADSRPADGETNVRLDLKRQITDQASSSNSWTFVLSDQNGWKVCSGHVVPNS